MLEKLVDLVKSNIKYVVCAVLTLMIVLPVIYATRFSFPCQDDFAYTKISKGLMNEGYSVLGQAIYMVKEWHMTWGGLYSSTFFGYLFSGIIQCDVHKLRIFEFLSAILYFSSLFVFVYNVVVYIFKLSKKEVITIYFAVVLLLNGVVYYGDFDVMYWFITSVQYLMLLSFSLLGVSLYISAIWGANTKRVLAASILSAILGLVASGANLGLAALNVLLYVIVGGYALIIKKRKKSILVVIVPIIGAVINAIAPGNFVRSGGSKRLADIIIASKASIKYVIERLEYYSKMPEFWIAFMVIILVTLFIPRKEKGIGVTIKWPAMTWLLSAIGCAGSIFPMMLGYGYEVFGVLIRGQFLLDFLIFIFLIANVLVLEQWLIDKYDVEWKKVIKKDIIIALLAVLLFGTIQERDDKWRWIGIVRYYRDLDANRFGDFASYYLDVLEQVKRYEGEIAVVYVDEVSEKTAQVNPMIVYDCCYDPELDYQNTSLAEFCGKKAAWVLHRAYQFTEEDIAVAQRLGVDLPPSAE